MAIFDIRREFDRAMDKEIAEHRYHCGKGIREVEGYWTRVGQIRAYEKAKELLAAILKSEDEDDDERGAGKIS